MYYFAHDCRYKLKNHIAISENSITHLTTSNYVVKAFQILQAGRMGRIRLSFINPLEVSLTRCRISLESPGAFHPIIEQVSDVRG